MKRKGFTLIELLAVIVVLAIIALIATPIVMNTIEKSKKGAAERTADNYIDAVETAVATKRLEGNILEGTYTINDKGNLEGNGLTEPLEIEMNGNKPSSGTITIKDGQVTTDTTMTIGDYDVKYSEDNKRYEAMKDGGATPDTPATSTVVYRWSTDTINIGETMSDPTKYTKDPSTLEKSAYLKHVLDKDNKVTESYACAIFNNEEYCVRGGDSSFYGYAKNEADYTGNALILKKIKDKYMVGLSYNFDAAGSYCSDGVVTMNANWDGSVDTNDVSGGCNVYDDGRSFCTLK